MLLTETAPDFSQPLELLRACHQKILNHCEMLLRLCQHVQTQVDDDAQKAAQQIHRYFSSAAQLHHEDEEVDLFPLLQHNPQASALIRQLQPQHVELGNLWSVFESVLADQQRLTELANMNHQAVALQQLYASHIEMENEQLLPLAATLLTPVQLQQLGANMQARRQA
ncbi:MAG: hemerythrin domain-containing protein [Chromatiales bacterium]|jgi:hemerythrin-like domain-containing protein